MYCARRLPLASVPVFAAIPLLGAAVDGSLGTGTALASGASFVLALGMYFYARRVVARIEGGTLRLHSGIGLAEVDRIDLPAISSFERPRPWFMTIRYGEGKSLDLEADKAVLNELSRDLAIFVGQKAEKAAAKP